jgi:hypothetical protein
MTIGPSATEELKAGRLVQPFPLKVPHRHNSAFACNAEHRMKPKIKRFEDWLVKQIAADPRSNPIAKEIAIRTSKPIPPAAAAVRVGAAAAALPQPAVPQLPRRKLKRLFPAMEIVSADELELIHHASLKVLSEIGMDFTLPEARDMLKKAGARVEGERVRFDPAMIEELISTVPSEFTFHRGTPRTTSASAAMRSPSARWRAPQQRRHGWRPPHRQLPGLPQLPEAGAVLQLHRLPLGLPGGADRRPCLDPPPRGAARCGAADRTSPSTPIRWAASASGTGSRSARIGRGISHEQLEREPSLFTIINTNSPLKLEHADAERILEMSSRDQIVCVTPFTLAGAMAPVTVAGALVEQNAEALAGIALHPARAQGGAGDLWRLHLERRHEVGCARLRHARIHEGDDRRRPAGTALQGAVPHLQRLCGEHGRRAGGL